MDGLHVEGVPEKEVDYQRDLFDHLTTPIFSEYLKNADREHFVIALLMSQNQLCGMHTAHVGTLKSCIVSSRDVFKAAILANAAAMICAHNHPSGATESSREDICITKRGGG